MKYRGSFLWIGAIALGISLFLTSSKIYSFGFSEGEKEAMNLQTFVISDFGDGKDQSNNIVWNARFSRFAKPADSMKEMSEPC